MNKLILFLALLSFNISAAPIDPFLQPESAYYCEYPTARDDANLTPLDWATEGAFITFHYGTTSGVYPNKVESTDCRWLIKNIEFENTTLYVVATSTDKDGRESEYSPETIHAVGGRPSKPKAMAKGVITTPPQ